MHNYARDVEYDGTKIEPMIACPHTVDNVKPLSEVRGTTIDQAFLGTCTNGRLDDLAAAAAVLEGKKIAHGKRMIVIPASEADLPGSPSGRISGNIHEGRRCCREPRLRSLHGQPYGSTCCG